MTSFKNMSPTGPTSLIELPRLAERCRVGRVFAKAENERELGNFKSLGGMSASFRAIDRNREARAANGESPFDLPTLICASDGNHGWAVATAAERAGVPARIYLPDSVAPYRLERIARTGAEIVRVRGSYDAAVELAHAAATLGHGILVADTTDDAEDVVVGDVMTGYLTVAHEVREQLGHPKAAVPTHLFVQAGVGGFAAAMAEGLGSLMGSPGRLIVVEPATAACVGAALSAGRPVQFEGSLTTCAEMLSCGVASAPALTVLLEHQAEALVVSEDELGEATTALTSAGGPGSSASGAAGVAGLLKGASDTGLRRSLQLDERSVILIFITEGPGEV